MAMKLLKTLNYVVEALPHFVDSPCLLYEKHQSIRLREELRGRVHWDLAQHSQARGSIFKKIQGLQRLRCAVRAKRIKSKGWSNTRVGRSPSDADAEASAWGGPDDTSDTAASSSASFQGSIAPASMVGKGLNSDLELFFIRQLPEDLALRAAAYSHTHGTLLSSFILTLVCELLPCTQASLRMLLKVAQHWKSSMGLAAHEYNTLGYALSSALRDAEACYAAESREVHSAPHCMTSQLFDIAYAPMAAWMVLVTWRAEEMSITTLARGKLASVAALGVAA
ncbi:unnamed protein product [Chrysoparadoxa australica]